MSFYKHFSPSKIECIFMIFGVTVAATILLLVIWNIIRTIHYLTFFNKLPMVMESTKEIRCIKAKVLYETHSRRWYYYIGFVLTDENNNKYYCFSPEDDGVRYPFKFSHFVKTRTIGKNFKIKYYGGTKLLIEPPFSIYEYKSFE